MIKVKNFKCPRCGKIYSSMKLWGNHMQKVHPEDIPDGWSIPRYFYFVMTGKTAGKCVMCGKPTSWNDSTWKYNRFCDDPACRVKYREAFAQRMIGKYGRVTLLDDPEHQRKMIMQKRTSGYYDFPDGKVGYSSSYELDFLKMCDKFLHLRAQDILQPSPHTYYYDYKNDQDTADEGRKFYIPDFFIPSLNLEIEIKQNTSTHPKILRVDKVKEAEKDAVMKSITGIHYIKIMDKKYDEFLELLYRLRNNVVDSEENEPASESSSAIVNNMNSKAFDIMNQLQKDSPEKVLKWIVSNIKYREFSLLQNPLDTISQGAGSCHDQMWLVHEALKNSVVGLKMWFVLELDDKGNGGMSHSFNTFAHNDKVWYIETAWTGQTGLHGYHTLADIRAWFKKMHQTGKFGNKSKYNNLEIYELVGCTPGDTLQALVRKSLGGNTPAMEMQFNSISNAYDSKEFRSINQYRPSTLTPTLAKSDPAFKHVRLTKGSVGEAFYDDEDTLVAYYMTEPSLMNKSEIWLTAMEVLPQFQGHKLGTQLLDRAVRLCKVTNLSVNKKNTLAKSIYEKYGFTVYRETEKMWFMRLNR